jgi:hypothetical protein
MICSTEAELAVYVATKTRTHPTSSAAARRYGGRVRWRRGKAVVPPPNGSLVLIAIGRAFIGSPVAIWLI